MALAYIPNGINKWYASCCDNSYQKVNIPITNIGIFIIGALIIQTINSENREGQFLDIF